MEMDPLLGAIAPRAVASPVMAATIYGVLSIGTSVVAAALEGRLVGNTHVQWGADRFVVRPFLSNVSTLLDFALLNPLAIFFLYRSRQIAVTEPLLAASSTREDRLLHWFASVCALLLSLVLMLAYSRSFLYGTFFDAVVTITRDGRSFVTVTGYVVFFWTGLFTYVVLMGALNQVRYVVKICQLKPVDLKYDPLHEDGAAGLRVLARPAIEFTKASLALLMAGVVFWIYDRIMLGAVLTDRTASIAIFTLIVFPLFAIPIVRLHLLMSELREDLLRSICGGPRRNVLRLALLVAGNRRDSRSMARLADEIVASERLRSTILSFPTWPMPTATLVSCSAYFASLSAPLFTKVTPLVLSALGIAQSGG